MWYHSATPGQGKLSRMSLETAIGTAGAVAVNHSLAGSYCTAVSYWAISETPKHITFPAPMSAGQAADKRLVYSTRDRIMVRQYSCDDDNRLCHDPEQIPQELALGR